MLVSACIDYFKDKFIMYLYFAFGKNVSFFQDLKYNVHLCTLWGGWGQRAGNSKEEAFPSPSFFSPFYP